MEIDGAGGSLRIVGWDKAEVWVTGTLGDGAEGLELSGSARRISVEVETMGHPDSVKSDLEVHVPAGARVEVSAMSADISVTNVTGTVTADTVAGDVSVTGSAQEIALESVNGSVTAACACARAHVESVNGAVTVSGGHGEIEASTVNGALTVTGGKFERAKLETVNGRITFEGELVPRATLGIESVGGSVELRLPAGTERRLHDQHVQRLDPQRLGRGGPPHQPVHARAGALVHRGLGRCLGGRADAVGQRDPHEAIRARRAR